MSRKEHADEAARRRRRRCLSAQQIDRHENCHENGGAHNKLITMPFSANCLAIMLVERSCTVRCATWPTRLSVQELGAALYWKLRDDRSARSTTS